MNDYSTPNSSSPKMPKTVEDYILLLQGVLNTYGNVPVRFSPDGEPESNSNVADVVIFQETKSLLYDRNNAFDSGKQMLVFTY